MHRRPLFVGLLVFSLVLSCKDQQRPVSIVQEQDPRWARIDSLERIGQFATALELTDTLLQQARGGSDWRTEFRAWMYRARFQQMTGVERGEIMAAIEQRAAAGELPLSPLLHSVLAEGWWNFYQDQRWEVLERTNTALDVQDPGTWTQRQFMEKVITEHRAALAPADTLKKIPVGELGDLLAYITNDAGASNWEREKAAARSLRPTLFDLLAHRALEVFTNSETRLAEPAWRFKLDRSADFELFEKFAYAQLTHRDSSAWELQALRLYQELERLHLSDTRPDALVDVTLERLAYVRDRSTVVARDSLYRNALEILRVRLPNDSCWSEVTLALARWHAEMGDQYDRLAGDARKWERKTARDLCDSAIARFPGSFGAFNAANLKVALEQPSLNLQCEAAVVPDAPFKVALTYRNVRKVWLRVVNDPVEINKEYAGDHDHAAWLTQQKPVKEWSVELPDDGNLNEHMVELPVEGMAFGHYAVLVCDTGAFSAHEDLITFAAFHITRLALIDRQREEQFELLVLDRSTGAPREGMEVWPYFRDRRSGVQRMIGERELRTDQDGRVSVKATGDQMELLWSVIDGPDRYFTDRRYYWGRDQSVPDSLRTFLFTDRAIYRPGQDVMFKGIVTVKRGSTTQTKSDHATTVKFFDVNGERIDSMNVTTDAFGSFHGSFKAPTGTLTGQMRIEEKYGTQWVRVEEYKRPTFEVVFDPIAGQSKLEENVKVSGVAKSYAGVPLDGAEVKWTVKRSARMPWWCGWGWRGLPWGQETEIASGTATADAQGKFTLTFLAQADRAFPQDADPTFTYSVEASATDLNGETQSSTTNLNLGYRGIDIDIGIGEAIDRLTTDSVSVKARNLNGEEVDVAMDVRVTPLTTPATVYRDRLWARPDRFVLQPSEHATLFAADLYDNENDPLNWKRMPPVLIRPQWRAHGRSLALDGVRSWGAGSYLIEVSATDATGHEVKVKKHFTIYDTTAQSTGFVTEAFHVERVKTTAEPGEKAVFLLSTALPEARILMEVERDGMIAVSRWFTLRNGQQRVELPVIEGDRGGFFVHLLCVERGRAHRDFFRINVPWSNKDLQVEWMSFRDKLQPGDNEEWRLKISGPKGEKVAAQLLAGMYDASLDHFVPHGWRMDLWPAYNSTRAWARMEPFDAVYGNEIWRPGTTRADTAHTYPLLHTYAFGGRRWEVYAYATDGYGTVSGALNVIPGHSRGRDKELALAVDGDTRTGSFAPFRGNVMKPETDREEKTSGGEQTPAVAQPLRSDFRETSFFFPDLLTDRDGSVVLRFKTPDALTRWKVLGLAHTQDLKLARFNRESVTQKPLMVFPNLPRFLRAGDKITLTAKINVVEEGRAEGLATLELFDPFTNASLDKSFGNKVPGQVFIAAKGESAVVSWKITVPEGVDACGLRITAASKAGPQSTIVAADGEERVLPVLTDKVLVTESQSLWASKAGTKTFTLDKLKNGTSTTLRHQSLKLEYTPNPAWYAVQALPYLMEFPHECAEQVFSRYYANRLAAHIVEERPVIQQVFEQWKAAGPDAFASALEKNAELKSALLAETPWVVNARDDRQRKERIALLFDLARMHSEEAAALKKLNDMQLPGGAWPWWSGMQESRWITQHIVAGLGHLEQLQAADLREDGQVQQMLRNAVRWLDNDVDHDHKRLQREWKKDDLTNYRPGYTEIHYLYARSFFRRWPVDGATSTAAQFYKDRLAKEWLSYGLQEQAMIALILHRMDDHATAALIMESLRQRAIHSEELGMYWKDFTSGMDWWSFPTETQALMIEAFDEVANDRSSVNALRTHLLKLKQTTDWKTTKATAEACYALLLTGDEWLDNGPMPVVQVGGVEVAGDRPDSKEQAGTGYFEKTWSAAEIKPAMGEVTVTTTTDKPSWGALHWQYFEQMDKVTPHESPFSIRKQVMLDQQTDAGQQLVPIDGSLKLKAGDLITIRIELRTDRPVDFAHLKDLRAAGLEPTEALSGYRYQGGLGYYQSIRDASLNFFFDRIPAGTHVFEYTLRVTHAGDFSNGITTVQCMYAPEFSSHSEGVRLAVEER